MKLGSLFSGSGGFELAGAMCGIEPIWASEIEPYPIAVTKNRLPNMRHLGDISKINGANIEPVDIITFGSPCQDLSVAGKRAGLKHEDNGDDETTRSGLFMEAVRIITEMRGATNGEYPKIAVWENVPGAFSSNKGEDFRTVLEELIKIVEPNAVMPDVPKKGWAYADCYRGDGWSLAYRVLDAQYIRTAQRRRRIYLVFCLTNERAGEILFKREGLRRNSPQSRAQRQGTATNVERSIGADHIPCTVYSVENHPNDSRVNIDDEGKVQALTGRMGTGGGNVPMVMERKPIALDRASFNQGKNALYDPQFYEDGTNPTLVAKGPSAVCYESPSHYIVRRLTPTECARLQGFPDTWGHIEPKSDLTDEEYKFWFEVRNTHAEINGKQVKDYTKKQMLTWYNKLWTDSAEYKMWGNGIALPCALYAMEGIAEALKENN